MPPAKQRNAINELEIDIDSVEEVKGQAEKQYIDGTGVVADNPQLQKYPEKFKKVFQVALESSELNFFDEPLLEPGDLQSTIFPFLVENPRVISIGFYMTTSEERMSSEDLQIFARFLKINANLVNVAIDSGGIGENETRCLTDALSTHPSVKGVFFQYKPFGDSELRLLLAALNANPRITDLGLNTCATVMPELLEWIKRNEAVRCVKLFNTHIQAVFGMELLAIMKERFKGSNDFTDLVSMASSFLEINYNFFWFRTWLDLLFEMDKNVHGHLDFILFLFKMEYMKEWYPWGEYGDEEKPCPLFVEVFFEEELRRKDGLVLAHLLLATLIYRENNPLFWKIVSTVSANPQFSCLEKIAEVMVHVALEKEVLVELWDATLNALNQEVRAKKGATFLAALLKHISFKAGSRAFFEKAKEHIQEHYQFESVKAYFKQPQDAEGKTVSERENTLLAVRRKKFEKKRSQFIDAIYEGFLRQKIGYYYSLFQQASSGNFNNDIYLRLQIYCQNRKKSHFKKYTNIGSFLTGFSMAFLQIFQSNPQIEDFDNKIAALWYKKLAKIAREKEEVELSKAFLVKAIQKLSLVTAPTAEDCKRLSVYLEELGFLYLLQRQFKAAEFHLKRAVKIRIYKLQRIDEEDLNTLSHIYLGLVKVYNHTPQRREQKKDGTKISYPVERPVRIKKRIAELMLKFFTTWRIEEEDLKSVQGIFNIIVTNHHAQIIKLTEDLLLFMRIAQVTYNHDAAPFFLESCPQWEQALLSHKQEVFLSIKQQTQYASLKHTPEQSSPARSAAVPPPFSLRQFETYALASSAMACSGASTAAASSFSVASSALDSSAPDHVQKKCSLLKSRAACH